MTKQPGWIKKTIRGAWHHLDVTLLILAAAGFTIAGLAGLETKFLSPVILALLGLLAISQIKSRSQVKSVADTWHRARTDLLSSKFPPKYKQAQDAVSHSYFYTGATMKRTMAIMGDHIPRILANGGTVRILLPDPKNTQLLEMIAATRPGNDVQAIRQDLENSLRQAIQLRSGRGSDKGTLEVRTIQFAPHVGINAFELDYPTGTIMVQMYAFGVEAGTERSPIIFLDAGDREWYRHFEDEIERLWDDGKNYSDPAGLPRLAPASSA